MKRPRLLTLVVAAAFLPAVVIGTVSAHHSTAIYDSDNPIELSGTVVEWRFTNPHCIIIFEVADSSGDSVIWRPGRWEYSRYVSSRLDADDVEGG